MEFIQKQIQGAFEIVLRPISDERGFFMRVFDGNLLKNAGINFNWVQENHSKSVHKGTLRGLHLQNAPHSETKLIRCLRGAVYDVFVDLRKGSPTFGKWDAIELTEENKKMALIPKGCAHAYCTLEDNSEVIYKVDNVYAPGAEIGILWNDPELKIDWPISDPILSEKDKKNITFKEFVEKFGSIDC